MLTQTTYRLWLRNEPKLNQTGLADGAAIDAAILALQPIPVTPNPFDTQD